MRTIFFSIVFFPFLSMGAESIPFKIKTRTTIYENASSGSTPGKTPQSSNPISSVTEQESVINISTEKIAKAIDEVRAGICKSIKNGHVKMWFSATAKGGIVVSETSAEAGIEVQFECKN